MPVKTLLQSTVCLLALGFAGGMAQAEEAAPFVLGDGQWSAVGQPAVAPAGGIPAVPASPVKPAAPLVQPVAAAAAAAAAAIAPPARALQMPVMPGVATPFQLDVKSTAEQPPSIAANDESSAPAGVQEQNWRQAATVARLSAIASAKANGDDAVPLNIRPSFLPDTKVAPIPAPQPAGRPRLKNLPVAAGASVKKPPALDAAACAAVDQYKQHQLAALQSDRQTLVALQAAIGELGLQKQLGYLTGMPDTATGAQAAAVPAAGGPDRGQP